MLPQNRIEEFLGDLISASEEKENKTIPLAQDMLVDPIQKEVLPMTEETLPAITIYLMDKSDEYRMGYREGYKKGYSKGYKTGYKKRL